MIDPDIIDCAVDHGYTAVESGDEIILSRVPVAPREGLSVETSLCSSSQRLVCPYQGVAPTTKTPLITWLFRGFMLLVLCTVLYFACCADSADRDWLGGTRIVTVPDDEIRAIIDTIRADADQWYCLDPDVRSRIDDWRSDHGDD